MCSSDLEKSVGSQRCELVLPSEIQESEAKEYLARIGIVRKVEVAHRKENEISYWIEGPGEQELRKPIADLIKEKGWNFLTLCIRPYGLEEIFLKLTEPEKASMNKKGA